MQFDREWSQNELRQYLLDNGWNTEDISVDLIPQGVKYISFEPLTAEDITAARELIVAHPEWKI